MITLSKAGARAEIIETRIHPLCLLIIEFLNECEHTLSEIFNLFQLDKSTISRHLFALREAGIISSQKTGTEMIDRLKLPSVTAFFNGATIVIENNVKRQLSCLYR